MLASLTMFLLAALLCNHCRGKCLIDIGTEGNRGRKRNGARALQVITKSPELASVLFEHASAVARSEIFVVVYALVNSEARLPIAVSWF